MALGSYTTVRGRGLGALWRDCLKQVVSSGEVREFAKNLIRASGKCRFRSRRFPARVCGHPDLLEHAFIGHSESRYIGYP
jgi:hypothetical protein